MMGRDSELTPGFVAQPLFAANHRSVGLAAADRQSQEAAVAFDQLCRTYWHPLYAYVRRRGHRPEDAQDLTQQFFTLFLQKQYFRRADPSKARLRSFMFHAMDCFLINQWKHAHRAKRGGFCSLVSLNGMDAEGRHPNQPATCFTPAQAYERLCAAILLGRVLNSLQQDYSKAGKAQLFEALVDVLWGKDTPVFFAEIGARLGLTEGAARGAMHRLRIRLRERLRLEIARTGVTPTEVDQELRALTSVFSGSSQPVFLA